MAFLSRITGIKLILDARQKLQDKVRATEHEQQAELLQRTHDRELLEMDRRYRILDRLDARENRSAETALKREEFQLLVQKKQQRGLKPEFEKAVRGTQDRGDTGDDKAPEKESVSGRFNRAGKPVPDLTEEFNREVEDRRRREDIEQDLDTGPDRTFDRDDPKK
jgi:hypothetical protein